MFRLARLILFVGIGFYLGYKYKEMESSAVTSPANIQITALFQKQAA